MTKINQITDSDNLKKPSEKVQPTSKETKKIVTEMKETIAEMDNALALAAPQIGINKQIVIISKFKSEEENIDIPEIVLINPKIVSKSKQRTEAEEGCLSVAKPELRGQVSRHRSVKIKYQDQEGNWQELEAKGLLARIIQHELDHLEGKTFLDRADFNTIYQVDNKNYDE